MTPGFGFAGHLGLRELGHGLGALGDGVLAELTGEDQADRRLDASAAEGRGLGHATQLAGLNSDLVEGVHHEVVHDGNALLGDTSSRVHLLEHLEDVALEGLDAALLVDALGSVLLGNGFRHDGRELLAKNSTGQSSGLVILRYN